MPKNGLDEMRLSLLLGQNTEVDSRSEPPTVNELEQSGYRYCYLYSNPQAPKGWRNDGFGTGWDCKSHWSHPLSGRLRRKIDRLVLGQHELHRWATQHVEGERIHSQQTFVEYFLKSRDSSKGKPVYARADQPSSSPAILATPLKSPAVTAAVARPAASTAAARPQHNYIRLPEPVRTPPHNHHRTPSETRTELPPLHKLPINQPGPQLPSIHSPSMMCLQPLKSPLDGSGSNLGLPDLLMHISSESQIEPHVRLFANVADICSPHCRAVIWSSFFHLIALAARPTYALLTPCVYRAANCKPFIMCLNLAMCLSVSRIPGLFRIHTPYSARVPATNNLPPLWVSMQSSSQFSPCTCQSCTMLREPHFGPSWGSSVSAFMSSCVAVIHAVVLLDKWTHVLLRMDPKVTALLWDMLQQLYPAALFERESLATTLAFWKSSILANAVSIIIFYDLLTYFNLTAPAVQALPAQTHQRMEWARQNLAALQDTMITQLCATSQQVLKECDVIPADTSTISSVPQLFDLVTNSALFNYQSTVQPFPLSQGTPDTLDTTESGSRATSPTAPRRKRKASAAPPWYNSGTHHSVNVEFKNDTRSLVGSNSFAGPAGQSTGQSSSSRAVTQGDPNLKTF